jgi:hypothetical protein
MCAVLRLPCSHVTSALQVPAATWLAHVVDDLAKDYASQCVYTLQRECKCR